jgi:hypothetical protein
MMNAIVTAFFSAHDVSRIIILSLKILNIYADDSYGAFIQHDMFARSFSKKSGTGVVQILTLAYVTRKMPFFVGWYRLFRFLGK